MPELYKIADIIVYQMLLFNGVPKEEIIYSNSNDPEANIPEESNVSQSASCRSTSPSTSTE